MIANVSPASLHFEESHNTLKYAGRARMIKTKLSQQVYYKYDPYSAAVNSLQSEIGDLKTKLKRRALSGSALALDTIKDSRDLMSSAPRSRERLSRSRSQSRNRLVAGLDGTVGGGGGGGGVRGDDAGSIMSLNYSGGGSSSKLLSNNINNNSTQQQPYNNFVELEEYEMTLERLFQQHAEAQSKLLQIDDELADNSIRLRRKRNYVIKLERIIRRESLEGYNVQPSALKREAEVRVVKSKTDIENFKNERMRLKTSRTAAAKNLLDIEEKIRMLQQV